MVGLLFTTAVGSGTVTVNSLCQGKGSCRGYCRLLEAGIWCRELVRGSLSLDGS